MSDRPSAVLLDVGGVFLLPSREQIRRAVEPYGVTVAVGTQVDRAHYLATRVFPFDLVGDGDDEQHWPRYLHAYATALGVPHESVPEAAERIRQAYEMGGLWSEVIDGSRVGLAQLVDTGVPVGIVSNSDGTVERRLREHRICQVGPGEATPVQCVIDSGAVGIEKPDPAIFHFALDAMGLAPDGVWYVGDTPGFDVVGARRAGLRPILMDPFDVHTDLAIARVHSLQEVSSLLP